VIVDDLDVEGVGVLPCKAEAPLIVDANAVLPFPPATELLESVSGRHAKVLERLGTVQQQEFAPGRSFDGTESRYGAIVKEVLS